MDEFRADDIIIPVMGITGSGKSTFIARCTGNVSGIGHSLESQTKDVSWGTLIHKGRTIRLIDTPGFDDSRSDLDDTHILKEIAAWLVIAYSQKPPLLLSGIIYLHPINEAGGRMRGSAKNNLKMFQAMCGNEPLSSVVLATTMWRYVDEQRGEKVQRQLSEQHWSSMIAAGSRVIRHDDSKESALRIIDHIMSRKAQVSLKIQKELVDKDQTVENTDAGRELKSKVIYEREKTDDKLKDVKDDLEQALKESDEAAAAELLELQEKFQATIRAKDAELNGMKVKAEELYRQKLEDIAAAEHEHEQRRKETEDKMAALKRELDTMQDKQMELQRSSGPPSYESSALENQNRLLQMELKQYERQMEILKWEEEQGLQALYHEDTTGIAKEQLATARRGVRWGRVGAVAGTVAAGGALVSCNVM